MKNYLKFAASLALAVCVLPTKTNAIYASVACPVEYGFCNDNTSGYTFWYENGKRQGMYGDPKNITDDVYGIERGREIYDPESDRWYWLDAVYDGKPAESKEVWMPYIYQTDLLDGLNKQGKWVRYNDSGGMIKGWYMTGYSASTSASHQVNNVYYYDPITGEMLKGNHWLNGSEYHFDEITGAMDGTEAWKDQYNRTLAGYADEHVVKYSSSLAFLDNDGIPELVIISTELDEDPAYRSDYIDVFTYRDGEIEQLATLTFEHYSDQNDHLGLLYYRPETGVFAVWAKRDDMTRHIWVALDYDGIQQIAVAEFGQTITFEGEEVTMEEYLAKAEELIPSAARETFHISKGDCQPALARMIGDTYFIPASYYRNSGNSVTETYSFNPDGTYTYTYSTMGLQLSHAEGTWTLKQLWLNGEDQDLMYLTDLVFIVGDGVCDFFVCDGRNLYHRNYSGAVYQMK